MAYTITPSFTGGSGASQIFAGFLQFTGGTASATDGSSGNTGTSTTPAAGSFTTTANGDIVIGVGCFFNAPASLTAGAGFTLENNSGHQYDDEMQIQSAAGAINPGFTITSGLWVCAGGAIKKSAGTFSLVGAQNTVNVAAASSVVLTPAGPPTTADCGIVCVAYFAGGSTNPTSRTVIDSVGNAWTELKNQFQNTNNLGVSIFYCLSLVGTAGVANSLSMLGCGT